MNLEESVFLYIQDISQRLFGENEKNNDKRQANRPSAEIHSAVPDY
jgi:hypothetical protein